MREHRITTPVYMLGTSIYFVGTMVLLFYLNWQFTYPHKVTVVTFVKIQQIGSNQQETLNSNAVLSGSPETT
jgi:hypothetical protein